MMEVLQGIKHERAFKMALDHLESLRYLPATRATHVRAADIYGSLRRRGITIRKPIDCLIAAIAVEHDAELLHNDRDFAPIGLHCGLALYDLDSDR
jgi:predicted nucleic acid-binding protein